MALDKRNTSLWVKIVIVVVAAVFAAGPALAYLDFRSSPGTQTAKAGSLEALATQYAGQIATAETQLQSDPTSYTVLVYLGNKYYDWGDAVRQVTAKGPGIGADKPMWVAAASYYERALESQYGDPAVATDMAISYHYSGDTLRAVAVIERTMRDSPKFAPAFFNAHVFYQGLGRSADEIRVLQTYLRLEPSGNSAEPARARLNELGVQPSAPATGSTPTTSAPSTPTP